MARRTIPCVSKIFAVVAVLGIVAIGSSSANATSDATCAALRKTKSPTFSRLWTTNYKGVWRASPEFVNSDGSMWVKAPWYAAGPPGRAARGPRGTLRITGKRLDQVAAPLRTQVQEVGVPNFAGSGVWAVVLTFPTEGCWSVTGRVERTTHTFQVLISRPS